MRKLGKATAIVLAATMMIAGISGLFAVAAGPDTINVSLRIEGVEETLYYEKSIEIASGATLEELMTMVNDRDETLAVVSADGTYISEIAGLSEGAYGGFSGWSFRVNSTAPTFGQNLVILEDRDEIVYYYGDPWGEPGMQYPVPDLSKLYNGGVIGFFSTDEEYDEEWNVTLVKNPVAGASVTFNGDVYITDENGEIAIQDITGVAGIHSLQIERYDEEAGVPTVLRLAPDFEMYVPFADTPDDAWYEHAVIFCVGKGLFIGTDSAKNLFSPGMEMTMAQLVTVLGRIAGEDFSAPSDPWYASARDWAVENGIIADSAFTAGENVTRETFIFMFYLAAELAGTYDMTVSDDITAAVDYDEINVNYRGAISWAVASGIISGTSSTSLTIAPGDEITRAQVCQMLLNYYN